jgi:hypothetical protein
MAVDLGDLIDSLKREVSPPGTDLFPNAIDDEYLGNLSDSFWDAALDGLISTASFTESDGVVSPVSPNTDDLTRDYQQLIVFYAGIRILRNHMMNLDTSFHAVAGPVEFQTSKSSGLVRDILAELVRKRNIILTRLSDVGSSQSFYVDAILARDESMEFGGTPYVGHAPNRFVNGFG